ncbi:MAG TPA: CapA family protein [Coleofasciculaceae cyanobacterium]
MVYAAGVGGSGSIGLTWDAGTLASWFDRYLAPHGIRTRVSSQVTGQLDVWVECQRDPERDRLVRFICHRLHGLNLAAVEGVRIMARRAGQAELLWQQSVPLEQRPGLSSPATAYYQRPLTRSPEQQVVQRLAQTWLVARDGLTALTAATRDRLRTAPKTDLGAIEQWLQPVATELGAALAVDRLNGRCLVVEVGLASPDAIDDPASTQAPIVQAVCRRLWQFNASERGNVSGVRIRATVAGQVDPLWQQTIRIAAPAGRRDIGLAGLAQWASDPALAGVWRSLLFGSATIVPFVLALWLASSSPEATRSPQAPTANPRSSAPTEQVIALKPAIAPVAERVRQVRSPVVQGALEPLPVVNHPSVNPADPSVTLMFGGDVTLSDRVKQRLDGNWAAAMAQFPEARSVDVAMVNLENPITDAPRKRSGKQFNFKSEAESVAALRAGGIDLVTLANNHTMDYNQPGLADTLATLDRSDIHAIGAGENITEARRPKILDVKGQRIAYFGYYNAHWHAATATSAGTNPRDNDTLAEDIRAVRNQVDWVVVNVHWGEELARYPASYQREIGRRAIDAGADLVVGHHPHVLQGAEIYKDRAIVYSLGNFIFGGNARSSYDTAVLKVALKDQQMKLEFVPVRVRNYQPRLAKGDRAREILQELTYLSRRFDRPLATTTVLTARSALETATAPAPVSPIDDTTRPLNETPATLAPSPAASPVTPKGDRPQPQLPSFTRSVSGSAPSSALGHLSQPRLPVTAAPSPATAAQTIQRGSQSARDRLAQLINAAELSQLVQSTDGAIDPIEAQPPTGRSPSFEIQPTDRPAATQSTAQPNPQLPFSDRATPLSGSAPTFTADPAQAPSSYSSLSLPALVKAAANRAQAMLEP